MNLIEFTKKYSDILEKGLSDFRIDDITMRDFKNKSDLSMIIPLEDSSSITIQEYLDEIEKTYPTLVVLDSEFTDAIMPFINEVEDKFVLELLDTIAKLFEMNEVKLGFNIDDVLANKFVEILEKTNSPILKYVNMDENEIKEEITKELKEIKPLSEKDIIYHELMSDAYKKYIALFQFKYQVLMFISVVNQINKP